MNKGFIHSGFGGILPDIEIETSMMIVPIMREEIKEVIFPLIVPMPMS